jgi:hypothetical protein
VQQDATIQDKKCTFKPTTGKESLHAIEMITLPHPKNLSEVQCSHILTVINLLGHILLDGRWCGKRYGERGISTDFTCRGSQQGNIIIDKYLWEIYCFPYVHQSAKMFTFYFYIITHFHNFILFFSELLLKYLCSLLKFNANCISYPWNFNSLLLENDYQR